MKIRNVNSAQEIIKNHFKKKNMNGPDENGMTLSTQQAYMNGQIRQDDRMSQLHTDLGNISDISGPPMQMIDEQQMPIEYCQMGQPGSLNIQQNQFHKVSGSHSSQSLDTLTAQATHTYGQNFRGSRNGMNQNTTGSQMGSKDEIYDQATLQQMTQQSLGSNQNILQGTGATKTSLNSQNTNYRINKHINNNMAKIQALSSKYQVRLDNNGEAIDNTTRSKSSERSKSVNMPQHISQLRQNSYQSFLNQKEFKSGKSNQARQHKKVNEYTSKPVNEYKNTSKILVQGESSEKNASLIHQISNSNIQGQDQQYAANEFNQLQVQATMGTIQARVETPNECRRDLQLNQFIENSEDNVSGMGITYVNDTSQSATHNSMNKHNQRQEPISGSRSQSRRSISKNVKKPKGDESKRPETNLKKNFEKVETFGHSQKTSISHQQQESGRAKSNTEVFHNLLIRSHKLQQSIKQALSDINKCYQNDIQNAIHNDEQTLIKQLSQQLIDIAAYPQISKKTKSFKEIADGLVSMLEFLERVDFFKKAALSAAAASEYPKSMLKKATRSGSRKSSLSASRSTIEANDKKGQSELQNLKFNNNIENAIQKNNKVINLQQIQEIKNRDNLIQSLQYDIKYLETQNQNFKLQLKKTSEQKEQEHQEFVKEIETQHSEMHKHFKEMQNDYAERLNVQRQSMGSDILKKNEEQEFNLQEIKKLQLSIKQFKNARNQRQTSIHTLEQDADKLSVFLGLENKNVAELMSELEYHKENEKNLETEIQTLDLEMRHYKQSYQQHHLLSNSIVQLENENQMVRKTLEQQQKERMFFEKECNILNSQIQAQTQRLEELQGTGIPEPRKKSPIPACKVFDGGQSDRSKRTQQQYTSMPRSHSSNSNHQGALFKQQRLSNSRSNDSEIGKMRSRSTINTANAIKKLNYDKPFLTDDRARAIHFHQNELQLDTKLKDKQATINGQAKTIEQLLIKIKKLKNSQIANDMLPLMKVDEDDEAKDNRQYSNTLEMKAYQREIQELYNILLEQSQHRTHQKLTCEQQIKEIKSYLNIQKQSNISKTNFRFDQQFFKLFDLSKVQGLIDSYKDIERNLKNVGQYIFSDSSDINHQRNEILDKIYEMMLQNAGQMFIVYQQMQRYKVQSKEQESNVNQLQKMIEGIFDQQDQDQYVVPEKQVVYELQKEIEVKTQKIVNMSQSLEVYKAESEIKPQAMEQILQSINANSIIANEDNNSHNRSISQSSFDRQKSLTKKTHSAQKFGDTLFKNQQRGRQMKLNKNKHSVFNHKKTWNQNLSGDPDLNEALIRIEKLQNEKDDLDKENQLNYCDSKKYAKENRQLEIQFEKVNTEYQEIKESVAGKDEKIKALASGNNNLSLENQEQSDKIQRLKDLNKEMRELIEQERLYTQEELQKMDNKCKSKIKSNESKYVILKNKMLQLANQLKVYVAPSFEMIQIIDSLLDNTMELSVKTGGRQVISVNRTSPEKEQQDKIIVKEAVLRNQGNMQHVASSPDFRQNQLQGAGRESPTMANMQGVNRGDMVENAYIRSKDHIRMRNASKSSGSSASPNNQQHRRQRSSPTRHHFSTELQQPTIIRADQRDQQYAISILKQNEAANDQEDQSHGGRQSRYDLNHQRKDSRQSNRSQSLNQQQNKSLPRINKLFSDYDRDMEQFEKNKPERGVSRSSHQSQNGQMNYQYNIQDQDSQAMMYHQTEKKQSIEQQKPQYLSRNAIKENSKSLQFDEIDQEIENARENRQQANSHKYLTSEEFKNYIKAAKSPQQTTMVPPESNPSTLSQRSYNFEENKSHQQSVISVLTQNEQHNYPKTKFSFLKNMNDATKDSQDCQYQSTFGRNQNSQVYNTQEPSSTPKQVNAEGGQNQILQKNFPSKYSLETQAQSQEQRQRVLNQNEISGGKQRHDVQQQHSVQKQYSGSSNQNNAKAPNGPVQVPKLPTSQLEKDRSLFNEKLERLKTRLNQPSIANSVEAFPSMGHVYSGPQTQRQQSNVDNIYQFNSQTQRESQKNDIQMAHSRSSSFLKMPMQMDTPITGILSPPSMGNQLEKSISQRLLEFENEQLAKKQQQSINQENRRNDNGLAGNNNQSFIN